MSKARDAAAAADVCLMVGIIKQATNPAADLAILAAARGIPVAEVSVDPTPTTSSVT